MDNAAGNGTATLADSEAETFVHGDRSDEDYLHLDVIARHYHLYAVRPCVVALILATALIMLLGTLLGFSDVEAGFSPDIKGIIIFVLLAGTGIASKKLFKKSVSPILMIAISACLGIAFYGL